MGIGHADDTGAFFLDTSRKLKRSYGARLEQHLRLVYSGMPSHSSILVIIRNRQADVKFAKGKHAYLYKCDEQ